MQLFSPLVFHVVPQTQEPQHPHPCGTSANLSPKAVETPQKAQGFIQQELRSFLFYHEVNPGGGDESLRSVLKGLVLFIRMSSQSPVLK